MADTREGWQTPYTVLSWDLLSVILVLVLTAILLVWAAFYYPNWVDPLSPFSLGALFDIVFISMVLGAKGLFAFVRNRTPILQTAEVRFVVSQFGKSPLSMMSPPIDIEALKKAGIPVPKDVKLEYESAAIPPGSTPRPAGGLYRPVPVNFVRLGGLLIEGFYTSPKDFFLIYFGNQIMTLGDSRAGVGFFMPRRVIAMNHKEIPKEWLDGLEKVGHFKPGKSTVLIASEISPAAVEWFQSNSEELLPYLLGEPPNKAFGWANADHFLRMWLGAETDKHYLRGQISDLRDENDHLRRGRTAEARHQRAVYEGSDMPPNIREMGARPAEYGRA